MAVIDEDDIWDFGNKYYDEIETDEEEITIYYVMTEEYNNVMSIKIKVEGGPGVLFYVMVTLVCIGVAIIIGAVIFTIYFMYCRQQNPFLSREWVDNADDRYKKILEESPESKYNSEKEKFNQIKCSICLVEFLDNDPIRSLRCQHIYHKNCIEIWIKEKILEIPKCPTCNGDLTFERPPGYIEPSRNLPETNQVHPIELTVNRNINTIDERTRSEQHIRDEQTSDKRRLENN